MLEDVKVYLAHIVCKVLGEFHTTLLNGVMFGKALTGSE